MDVIAAYQQVGTYRGAAAMCGTTHKTVKRIIERAEAGGKAPDRVPRGHNYDLVAELVADRVAATQGRISAKRLLPVAKAAGYAGSPRNFRRLVAGAKKAWRRDNHRGRRPAVWAPGEVLAIDWGSVGALHVFCAVLAWSRVPVRAVRRQRAVRDHAGDARGVLRGARRGPEGGARGPDGLPEGRRGREQGGACRGLRPLRDAITGFRPDWCEAADPESKGIVENLVGYAKRDLIVPQAPVH